MIALDRHLQSINKLHSFERAGQPHVTTRRGPRFQSETGRLPQVTRATPPRDIAYMSCCQDIRGVQVSQSIYEFPTLARNLRRGSSLFYISAPIGGFQYLCDFYPPPSITIVTSTSSFSFSTTLLPSARLSCSTPFK